jgi:hypothetical protein
VPESNFWRNIRIVCLKGFLINYCIFLFALFLAMFLRSFPIVPLSTSSLWTTISWKYQ